MFYCLVQSQIQVEVFKQRKNWMRWLCDGGINTSMGPGGGDTRPGCARSPGCTLGGAPLQQADVQLEENEEIKRCDERKAKVTFQHDTQCILISLTAPRLRETGKKVGGLITAFINTPAAVRSLNSQSG